MLEEHASADGACCSVAATRRRRPGVGRWGQNRGAVLVEKEDLARTCSFVPLYSPPCPAPHHIPAASCVHPSTSIRILVLRADAPQPPCRALCHGNTRLLYLCHPAMLCRCTWAPQPVHNEPVLLPRLRLQIRGDGPQNRTSPKEVSLYHDQPGEVRSQETWVVDYLCIISMSSMDFS